MERLTHVQSSSATEIYILQPSRLTQPQPSHAQHASLGGAITQQWVLIRGGQIVI